MKEVLLFGIGLAIGAVSGILACKEHYKKKYSKYVEELEAYYEEIDCYARVHHDEDNEVNPEEEETPAGGRMSKKERAEIKEKLNTNWTKTTDYAGMYNKSKDDQNNDAVDEVSAKEEEMFDEKEKNKTKPPRIISAEDYSNLGPGIDQETLWFYTYDEALTDDNNEVIEDPERFVGDALTKYNFIDSDEINIFVMNYELNTCYDIQKVEASWTDSQ